MITELDTAPQFDLIARSLIKEKKRLKKGAPKVQDLSSALTSLHLEDQLIGSSTLELGLLDDEYQLLDSGFFDADKNGKVDPIDLNYPFDSNHWWRLTQVEYQEDCTATLSFMERPAVYMQQHHGPFKTRRGKVTRAMFLRQLTSKVKAGGGIRFVSHDLRKKQPLEKAPKKPKTRKQAKDKGISPDEARSLTIGGVHATLRQIKHVETAMDVAERLGAGDKATRAMLVAGIGESNFTNVVNSLGYGGVFQGQVAKPGGANWFAPYSEFERTRQEAHYFLKGGRGYNQGGAIHLAKTTNMDIGAIATAVETSGEAPSYYGNWAPEADALLAAYGGVSNDAAQQTYVKKYNFQVGTASEPHETYWDAALRLAQEVNWPFFLDGNTAYYDPETTLIKQKPAKVIYRQDPAVITWRVTADNRNIASQAELDLICDPMEFRVGEVFSLRGFGPASSLSTADLPGRWLIEEVLHDVGDVFCSFTLKQPQRPKPEPAQRGIRSTDAAAGEPIQGTPKTVIDRIVVPIATDLGFQISAQSIEAGNRSGHVPGSDHYGPPSQRWAADISDSTSPSPRMDKLAKTLLRRFDAPVKNIGSPHANDGRLHPENFIEWHAHGYRFQLIYRTDLGKGHGGNHFNHVHFGLKWDKFSGPPTPKPRRTTGGGPYGTGTLHP